MDPMTCWRMFEQSGKIEDYLGYLSSLEKLETELLEKQNEAEHRRAGNLGTQDGGGGSSHYDSYS